jgi:Ca2+-binding RTX toxin-like protein
VRVALALALVLFSAGTPGDDVLSGTEHRDSILAGPGDDRIAAYAGNDLVDAGLGNDVVYSGEGNDAVYGGPGNDRLVGGAGRDFLSGNVGDDVIDARDPSLRELADGCLRPCWRPKLPPNADTVWADAGDDRILARDRRVDAIRCHGGRDVVSADRIDRISPFGDCEVVVRR